MIAVKVERYMLTVRLQSTRFVTEKVKKYNSLYIFNIYFIHQLFKNFLVFT